MSRNFENLPRIYKVFGFPNLTRKWKNGMLERWNIGFQKDISDFNFTVNAADGGTIDLSEA